MKQADWRELLGLAYRIGAPSVHAFNIYGWRGEFRWKDLESCGELPTQPGVDIVVTYDDIPIYVGSTSVSLRQRLTFHHRRRAFAVLGATRVAYKTCSDPEGHGLYALELDAMRQLLPVLNDRSDDEIAVEFFEGRRRFIPISTGSPIGWNVKWKRRIGRPPKPKAD